MPYAASPFATIHDHVMTLNLARHLARMHTHAHTTLRLNTTAIFSAQHFAPGPVTAVARDHGPFPPLLLLLSVLVETVPVELLKRKIGI